MIVFLTLVYVALLFVLVKMKVLPNKPATWLSIIVYVVVLFIFLFIPMQWGAPSGSARLMTRTIQIIPNVNGQVESVEAQANVPLEAGAPLFQIDPEPFEIGVKLAEATLVRVKTQALQDQDSLRSANARLRQAQATLNLAQMRYDDDVKLFGSGAIAQSRLDQRIADLESAIGAVEQAQSEVSRLETEVGAVMEDGTLAKVREAEANLANARWNLEQTTVTAPVDGFATNVALAAGQRVTSLPLAPALVYADTSEHFLIAEIHQIFLRHVETGQPVEVAFKLLPGRVFPAKVHSMIPLTQGGQAMMSGGVPAAGGIAPEPIFVRIEMEDPDLLPDMPVGTVGSVAIYTESVQSTHVIRKVMIRMQAILSYINPML